MHQHELGISLEKLTQRVTNIETIFGEVCIKMGNKEGANQRK